MFLTRKKFLQLLSATAATPLAAYGEAKQQKQDQEPGAIAKPCPSDLAGENTRRPNVLILMTDQHRRDYMTAAGNSTVPTPNIDRIASRGVRFTNAVCPYPVCAASRAALMSGLYPHTTGVINNNDRLPWNTQTIGTHFSRLGYHTGLIGKAHFNDAHRHGFEYFLGFNDWFMYLGPKVHTYANEIAYVTPFAEASSLSVNNGGAGLPELPLVWGKDRPWTGHVEPMGFPSGFEDPGDEFEAFVARESCQFLQRYGKGQEPFLLIASFLRPHPPAHPPHPWAEHYPPQDMTLPPVGDPTQYPRWIQARIQGFQSRSPDAIRGYRAGYRGNLAYVDTCVGKVYQTLEQLGLTNNTIVIYTADHGEMDGDHGLYEKFCFFNPSVGVPLIVSQPGRFPQGKTSDALVEYFAIFPTVAELIGAPAPHGIDARSFASLVREPNGAGPEAQFSEYNLRSARDCYMVRTRQFKYNYNHDDLPELYDLEADPNENVNLAGQPSFARERAEMHDRLMAWYNPANNPYRNQKQI